MMNRSVRAPDTQRKATSAANHRQQPRSPLSLQRGGKSLGAVIKEKDEELALFLEMRKREKERNSNLLVLLGSDNFEELDRPPGSKLGNLPIFKIASKPPVGRSALDDFLGSDDTKKNDYDWLLTPPGTPLFPSLEKESNRSPTGHIGMPKTCPTVLKSRLANPHVLITRGNSVSIQPTSSSSTNSSFIGTHRPSSSIGGPNSVSSRATTPTRRSTLPATSRSPRPSTPTSRATLPSKPVAPPRSSTPVRSSTPTSRPYVPPSNKPVSRVATPTRRPSTPSSVSCNSSVPTRSARSSSVIRTAPITSKTSAPSSVSCNSSVPTRSTRSSSVIRTAPVTSKTSAPSCGTSPTVKSRPWKPSEIPGFSLDAPLNLRTSLLERPISASRGRPGTPTSLSSSVVGSGATRPRRQSCSPSRGRIPNGSSTHSRSSVPARAQSCVNSNDILNPVLIGNKMVERVINSRRLAPPMQGKLRSVNSNLEVKSSVSSDSAAFGSNLSKKSLDMAMRHMDIKRSIPNHLRPLMTNVPASSMYSVRSVSGRSRGISVSDSPLGTSSNASSEPSVNNSNIIDLEGNEAEDGSIRIVKQEISLSADNFPYQMKQKLRRSQIILA